MSYIIRKIIKKPHAAMHEIHKGKRRRKTRIWLADLYFLDALLQAARTSLRDLQRIKKVEISEPDCCMRLPSSFALVYFGRSRMLLF